MLKFLYVHVYGHLHQYLYSAPAEVLLFLWMTEGPLKERAFNHPHTDFYDMCTCICMCMHMCNCISVFNLSRQTCCLQCNAGEVLAKPAPPSAITLTFISSGRPAAFCAMQERCRQSQPLPLHRHYVYCLLIPLFYEGASICSNLFSMREPLFCSNLLYH